MQENGDRKSGPPVGRAIGALAGALLDPIARARGFAATALLTEWPSIVGVELAGYTAPDKVIWPRRTDDAETPPPQSAWRADGAILVLRVEGPRAIELQHSSGQILERINVYFGYRAIAHLRFLQAPIARIERTPEGPEPAAEADTGSIPESISDDGLRQALARLGSNVGKPER